MARLDCFSFFDVILVICGIIWAIYRSKNAAGEDQYSASDITDSSEEGAQADKWVKSDVHNEAKKTGKVRCRKK